MECNCNHVGLVKHGIYLHTLEIVLRHNTTHERQDIEDCYVTYATSYFLLHQQVILLIYFIFLIISKGN
jgi:hypothetical protein